MQAMRHDIEFWANHEPAGDIRERMYSLVFSLLNTFDGTKLMPGLPLIDFVLRPHPDDKAYQHGKGENWYEDGQVINDDVSAARRVGSALAFQREQQKNARVRKRRQTREGLAARGPIEVS